MASIEALSAGLQRTTLAGVPHYVDLDRPDWNITPSNANLFEFNYRQWMLVHVERGWSNLLPDSPAAFAKYDGVPRTIKIDGSVAATVDAGGIIHPCNPDLTLEYRGQRVLHLPWRERMYDISPVHSVVYEPAMPVTSVAAINLELAQIYGGKIQRLVTIV
jgi:hypothetical protein